jgi:hypothetical protein
MTLVDVRYNDEEKEDKEKMEAADDDGLLIRSGLVDDDIGLSSDGEDKSNDGTHDTVDSGNDTDYGFPDDSDEEYFSHDDEENDDDKSSDDGHLPPVEVVLKVIGHPSTPSLVSPAVMPGTSEAPTPRGYHTATAISICKQDYLLVWGGLGNREALAHDEEVEGGGHGQPQGSKPLTNLECMNCSTLNWHTQVQSSGAEPSSRFGHSCTFHPRTNSIILMGGSDGTDLLRNGHELRDVSKYIYILD